jgi:DNA-binding Lrp family transcriptional regulator
MTIDERLVAQLQDGLPRVRRPFDELARRLGVSTDEVLTRLASMKADGRLRRLAAVVDQRRIGLAGNIMVAWNVPDDRLIEVGRALAAEVEVTHAYVRRPGPDWPYQLYTMVHAASEEVCGDLVCRWAAQHGLTDYQMLPTVREWKKSPPVYFV